MAVQPVPEGYHTVTPYLIVEDVARLIDFLRQAFGAKEISRHARPDGSIMHAEVRIGDSVVMIGGATDEIEPLPGMLHLYVEDADALYKRALEAGATSLRAPEDQFYGDRSAGVQEASGVKWWIHTHIEDVPPEELREREERFRQKQQEDQ